MIWRYDAGVEMRSLTYSQRQTPRPQGQHDQSDDDPELAQHARSGEVLRGHGEMDPSAVVLSLRGNGSRGDGVAMELVDDLLASTLRR